MTSETTDIPLATCVESPEVRLVLARPAVEGDRRIEDWIASNLDLDAERGEGNHWNRLIANLPVFRKRPGPRGDHGATVPSRGGWQRFQVAYRRGFTIVRIVDQALVQQAHIEELGCDLMDLIDVGNHRLIVNFSGVERLGSWIIGVVAGAHRRCADADGGKLKLCGLDPNLAEIFSIVGMAGEIDLQPDEATAIETPWPARTTPRQLPVDILAALGALSELPPISGGAPVERVEAAKEAVLVSRSNLVPPSPAQGVLPSQTVVLHVRVKDQEPRAVAVASSEFLIGRERPCRLRFGSAQVSKRHAAIEQSAGRVYLRDLGSTNGTLINGRKIRGEAVEVHHEDQIQIGPVLATLSILPAAESSLSVEALLDEPSASLNLVELDPHQPQEPAPLTEELPEYDDLDPAGRIKHEVLEDVLVVTPQIQELDDDATLEALRSTLQTLQDRPLPRRVVVNLEFVSHLSRQAIALLLAHHVRLEWGGGALRICQAHARIIALLDQVRLTMLIDCYPTLDEAVLAAWTTAVRKTE